MTENTPSTASVDHEEATATAPYTEDGDDTHPLPANLAVDAPEDLDYAVRTYVHEDADYCARDTDGRVVVGVTNGADEVLLLVNDERNHAILPNCHVEDGDWADVARRTVEESTGIAIDLDGPEIVRAVDHEIEGDGDEDKNTSDGRTYHVVFRGTPAVDDSDTEPSCEDPDWRAGWYDDVPDEIDSDHGDARGDVERFLD